MSTAVTSVPNPLESYTLIYVEVEENSNKVWKGSIFDDGTFVAEWGRVGYQLQRVENYFSSVSLARRKLERMKRQKLRKGYTEARILDLERPTTVPLQPEEVKEMAASQIRYGRDVRSRRLIQYLTEVNIHQILSQTNIVYNAEEGTFTTPLGLVTPDAIAAARKTLAEIAKATAKNRPIAKLASQYLRLIPQNLGAKLNESPFRSQQGLQHQNEILDALDAALLQTSVRKDEKVFDCIVQRVPGSTLAGRRTFREIRKLYRSTINSNHVSCTYKLRRVYEVTIPSMQQTFAAKAAKIGNVKQHWHGTKASNLLSILKQGLIIPPADSVHCTGRMFGNGIYGSEQSTKALNYATNYWNASGDSNQRAFMLVCDFAMGREFRPQGWGRHFPVKGYDSTYVDPGAANVINQESIVYNTDQVNIKYLCEFE